LIRYGLQARAGRPHRRTTRRDWLRRTPEAKPTHHQRPNRRTPAGPRARSSQGLRGQPKPN
jgi:hypothetical protein